MCPLNKTIDLFISTGFIVTFSTKLLALDPLGPISVLPLCIDLITPLFKRAFVVLVISFNEPNTVGCSALSVLVPILSDTPSTTPESAVKSASRAVFDHLFNAPPPENLFDIIGRYAEVVHSVRG